MNWGRVVVLRQNGRFVRDYPARSRYNAKQIRKRLEDRYDPSYRIEVRQSKQEGKSNASQN